MKVLIVAADDHIAERLVRLFRHERRCVISRVVAPTLAISELERSIYDVLLFQLTPPLRTSIAAIRGLRNCSAAPSIVALIPSEDKSLVAEALDSGADDCITLPFSPAELVARCEAIVRRDHADGTAVLEVGGLKLKKTEEAVWFAGKQIQVSWFQFRILEYLVEHNGTVVAREELLQYLFDSDWRELGEVLDLYLSDLRSKLIAGDKPLIVTTLQGYKLA